MTLVPGPAPISLPSNTERPFRPAKSSFRQSLISLPTMQAACSTSSAMRPGPLTLVTSA